MNQPSNSGKGGNNGSSGTTGSGLSTATVNAGKCKPTISGKMECGPSGCDYKVVGGVKCEWK